MKISRVTGNLSEILQITPRDSSSTTGGFLASLSSGSPGIVFSYIRNNMNSEVVVPLRNMDNLGSYAPGGLRAISGGAYQLCPPDSCFTSGRSVLLRLQGATNLAPLPIEIELTGWDNQNAVSGGISRLDSTISSRMGATPLINNLERLDSTVSSRMGIFTLPTNFAALSINASGQVTAASIAAGGIASTSFTAAALNAMADALLDRNMATGVDSGTESVRTPRQALRVMRNKVETNTSPGNVYKEDDTTVSFTFTITTAAGNPTVVFDPTDV